MKNKKLILNVALITAVVGVSLYLLHKNRHKKRLATVSDAGYETAWDVHFPLKYKKQAR